MAKAKKKRKKLEQQVQEYLRDGWRYLDDSKEHLVLGARIQNLMTATSSTHPWQVRPCHSDVVVEGLEGLTLQSYTTCSPLC